MSAGCRGQGGLPLQIDDKLEPRRPHHREVSRLLAFEDEAGLNAHLAIVVGAPRYIAHQAASFDNI